LYRVAGIRVTFSGYTYVTADCCVDESKLAQRFPLPEYVTYQELQIYERSLEDPP